MKLLEIERPLYIETSQTAFAICVDAAQGVCTPKRTAGLAKDWDETAVVIHIERAFDKVAHKVRTDALVKNASLCCATCKQHWITWLREALHRGVPQGAPDSPLIFTCVTDEIFDELQEC